jgi:hypothetical protein
MARPLDAGSMSFSRWNVEMGKEKDSAIRAED